MKNKRSSIKKRLIVGFTSMIVSMLFIAFSAVSIMQKMAAQQYTEKYLMQASIVICTITGIAMIYGIVVEVMLLRAIRRPIEVLRKASRKLSHGNIEVELKKFANDELGDLTDDFEKLAENIKYHTEVAEKISRGDMAQQVNVNSEKDILGNALAKIVIQNNSMLLHIRDSAEQVALGANQVAGASQALAEGTTEQASALQQVTASINEITESTKFSAEQARVANELVNNVKRDAENGNAQMQDMIQAMQQINESSESISKIIKVIDDIAFQTNILALNAAVEAARAGVHGKGFAVVAEEVRNLAGKSAQAANETAEMIEDSIRKVNLGSKLAEKTAEALDVIVNAVDKSVELMDGIAETAMDQATAVAQIDQALVQVSMVVQSNSATSEECAAASEELLNQVVVVKELMEKFKLSKENRVAITEVMSDEK